LLIDSADEAIFESTSSTTSQRIDAIYRRHTAVTCSAAPTLPTTARTAAGNAHTAAVAVLNTARTFDGDVPILTGARIHYTTTAENKNITFARVGCSADVTVSHPALARIGEYLADVTVLKTSASVRVRHTTVGVKESNESCGKLVRSGDKMPMLLSQNYRNRLSAVTLLEEKTTLSMPTIGESLKLEDKQKINDGMYSLIGYIIAYCNTSYCNV